MTDDPVDPEAERAIRAGEEAYRRLLASDPRLREKAARYRQARDKLRVGMRAMLDHYAWKRERENAEAGDMFSVEDREGWRIEARDHLLAEIANLDEDGLPRKSTPQGELSELAFWVLSEALDTICTDKRTYRD